ncbi:MAG: hypothetical protein ICV87_05225, partial [Gemmatimonadetes bacterium]|nr:hypothetical protein [Gemmatimonadota bacterium]
MIRSVLLLLALAGCASAPRSAAPAAPAAVTDEAAVYAAVIDHFVGAGKSAVVIDSTNLRGPVGSDVARRASAELASSFAEANRAPRAIPRPLPTARTIRFTRHRELPFSAPGAGVEELETRWRRFGELFPGAEGFYQFSAIGFDAARSTAVLYTSHSCGSLCGSGNLVTLRRTGGRWQV